MTCRILVRSKTNSVGMDMSTEQCKNNLKKKNQKVLKVLYFEYISHPRGSKTCWENSTL